MEDVISLVLVAAVVAIGAAGLFGRRQPPARPAATGQVRRPGTHRQPPAYRIVQPSGTAGPPAAGRPVPGAPVGVTAGTVGVHDGATRLMPAVLVPEDGAGGEGPDPDAVLLARGHPTGAGDPPPQRSGPPDPGTVTGPGGAWAPRRP